MVYKKIRPLFIFCLIKQIIFEDGVSGKPIDEEDLKTKPIDQMANLVDFICMDLNIETGLVRKFY